MPSARSCFGLARTTVTFRTIYEKKSRGGDGCGQNRAARALASFVAVLRHAFARRYCDCAHADPVRWLFLRRITIVAVYIAAERDPAFARYSGLRPGRRSFFFLTVLWCHERDRAHRLRRFPFVG